MRKVIHRYIFRELWPPFGISVLFFTFVFLMTELIKIAKIIVNYQVDVQIILLMLAYSMPSFLQFIVPMSVMIAVLLTFLRLSGDMEIVALKAGGVCLYSLLPPVMLFSLIGFALTGFMTVYGMPLGRVASKLLLYQMASQHLNIALKPRHFIDDFKDVVLYVHEIASDATSLRDVFIEDRRSDKLIITVVAPRGQLIMQPEQLSVNLRLFDGTIHQLDVAQKTVYTLKYDSYDVKLDLRQSVLSPDVLPKSPKEMRWSELGQSLKAMTQKDGLYFLSLIEWHKKFSLPAACPALALLAVPLGIRSRSSKRAYGILLGLVFFLVYYIMLSIGWVWGETGVYPPFIGMWLPNSCMAAIGCLLLSRAVKEAPPVLPPLRPWIAQKLHRYLRRWA